MTMADSTVDPSSSTSPPSRPSTPWPANNANDGKLAASLQAYKRENATLKQQLALLLREKEKEKEKGKEKKETSSCNSTTTTTTTTEPEWPLLSQLQPALALPTSNTSTAPTHTIHALYLSTPLSRALLPAAAESCFAHSELQESLLLTSRILRYAHDDRSPGPAAQAPRIATLLLEAAVFAVAGLLARAWGRASEAYGAVSVSGGVSAQLRVSVSFMRAALLGRMRRFGQAKRELDKLVRVLGEVGAGDGAALGGVWGLVGGMVAGWGRDGDGEEEEEDEAEAEGEEEVEVSTHVPL
ncbi:uncharacterized protein K452DRAFT_296896 [Aplosporella prunicola CBS 121167]|uniref:Uncharacterized protein n=1 Tax=Aplosporella prunicola CBS 121167 TaxID=1176127 RepID=A0A6A6BKU2_9PEZI|nr:uncharacterized protein K452DRAFT_296896 [Aplosporella prunicola CBS 121167]KAF2143935.1 hypothetical protein K452DRAFT_296896 [Aplosporella prunicola CBS 121167]